MSLQSLKQVVILAAGKSSRFEPFDHYGHKCTYTIAGKTILEHLLNNLNQSGFDRAVVVTNPEDQAINQLLKQPTFKSVKLIHQKNPLGQADAIIQALPLLDPRFVVLNPQQINVSEHFSQADHSFRQLMENPEALGIFSQETSTPEKYGMLKLDGNRITEIVEKPSQWLHTQRQRALGIWILTKNFVQYMSQQKTEEYQFERDLSRFAQTNPIFAIESQAESLSLKYPSDLFPIAKHILTKTKSSIHPSAQIHPTAIIEGQVTIEAGAKVYHHSLIQGPVYLGKDTVVGSFCKVRAGSILEAKAEAQNAVEIKHSLLGYDSHIHSGFIGDSIIGRNVKIGAGFITANRRLDRDSIAIKIKGKYVDTHSSSFGAIIGDHVSIGIHAGVNPGRIIPSNTVVPPGTIW